MKISLITLEGCPPCVRSKAILRSYGIPFEEVTSADRPRFYALLGISKQKVAPQLFIDDNFVSAGGAVSKYINGHIEFLKTAS